MDDLKIISSLKNIIHAYWNSLPNSALEENEVAESCYRWLEKQGQKPAWNEDDERVYQSIIDDNAQENLLYNEQINWLISLKKRIGG